MEQITTVGIDLAKRVFAVHAEMVWDVWCCAGRWGGSNSRL